MQIVYNKRKQVSIFLAPIDIDSIEFVWLDYTKETKGAPSLMDTGSLNSPHQLIASLCNRIVFEVHNTKLTRLPINQYSKMQF